MASLNKILPYRGVTLLSRFDAVLICQDKSLPSQLLMVQLIHLASLHSFLLQD